MFYRVSSCLIRAKATLNDPVIRGTGFLTGGQLITYLLPTAKIVTATRMIANAVFFSVGIRVAPDQLTPSMAVALSVIGLADAATALWIYNEFIPTSGFFAIALGMSLWGGTKIHLAMLASERKSDVFAAV